MSILLLMPVRLAQWQTGKTLLFAGFLQYHSDYLSSLQIAQVKIF